MLLVVTPDLLFVHTPDEKLIKTEGFRTRNTRDLSACPDGSIQCRFTQRLNPLVQPMWYMPDRPHDTGSEKKVLMSERLSGYFLFFAIDWKSKKPGSEKTL